MFFLYGTSCTAFSMIFGALFSKSKTAILVGVLVFFVSYFTIFSITSDTSSSLRQGLSMFNTIAMAEGFNRILVLEGA
jgi:ABC-type transport system involved in multi-copper enzyme maturation permease subunit